ncbi:MULTISPECIES: hypothetical protein [Streptomyces]|uniref:hypothetical protein n=1 Tax=Streptomyces TaxID=1883 RepID=UPI0013161B6D|nr:MULTISPECIES: hypothetical protein [Streptomyces]QGZ50691.1 hypothetical protein GPZ77_22020 [Streptomyces sp. QHH-9511]GGT83400.1 hypothetical protein GCM10010272_30100 [Streptomyces lateritius]
MSHQDSGAPRAPERRSRHASARRAPGVRWGLFGGGVLGVGLLAAVVAAVVGGTFRSGQDGGSRSEDDRRPGMPALIQADPSSSGDSEGAGGDGNGDGNGDSGGGSGEGTGAPRPGTATESAAATGAATPSASVTPSGDEGAGAGSGAVTASPTAATDGSGGRPGKSGSAPGASKRPK